MAQENSALIRRWVEEVCSKGRMEAIDEMASPDIIGHGQAQHDTDIGLHDWTSTMTHKGDFLGFPATGKKATITGTSIQRISNGKIVEGWDNWDQLGLLVQIGAVPAAHFVKPADRRTA